MPDRPGTDLEALTGLEPVVEVLQTSALPLGYSAVRLVLSLAGGWWVFLSSGRNVSTAFLVCKQGRHAQAQKATGSAPARLSGRARTPYISPTGRALD